MKKILLIVGILAMVSCRAPKVTSPSERPLYEILTQQQSGGATIRFFEILTQEKEIAMLRGDKSLEKKITPDDIRNSNFVILNMGEKPTAGYQFSIAEALETPTSIILTVEELEPDGMAAQVISYPYAVVRINSKKEIRFK